MKTSATGVALLAAACLSLALLTVARAAPLPLESKIDAVTVYTDRAVVTRVASVPIAAGGRLEVAFEDLPASLIGESITLSGAGTARATIVDVSVEERHVAFTPNARVKAQEDELLALKRQRRQLDDRAAVLNAQEGSLAKLESAATATPAKDGAPRLSIDEAVQLLAFLEAQRTKLVAERQALDAQIEELGRKHSAVELTLSELRGNHGRRQTRVTARLDIETTGTLELSLGYALRGAGWSPVYDVRVGSAERAMRLGYFALVRQNTGEDWKDVALTLSTARPNLGGAAPMLTPWTLDLSSPPVQQMEALSVGGNLSRAKQAAVGPRPVKFGLDRIEASIAQVDVEAAATSASFRVAQPSTVLSNNSPQKVPVTSTELTALPEYLTVPKKLAAAFLTAKAVNTSDFPLLAGPANVFLDGTFVATSPLRSVMPGEKFELSLGADEGISVKHTRVNRFAEDTGLTGSGKRVTYEYLITLQNNKRTSERIVVADHVPVSRHEKIVVKMLTPAERELKPANDGTLKWTVELKPGEKREIPFKFSIDYPNDITPTGLES